MLAVEQFKGWLVFVFAVPLLLLFIAIMLKVLNIMTGGLLSRHEKSARWFYPVDRVIVLLSLSFVYQPAYEILASNTSKWLVKGVVLLFIGVILVYEFRVHNIHTVGLNYHFYYDDQRPPGYLTPGFSIQSDLIEQDVLRVFIPGDELHLEVARTDCPDLLNFEFQGVGFFGNDLNLGAFILKWPERLKYMECVRSQYRFWLDDEEVSDVVFQMRSRPESGLMRHGFKVFVRLPREKSGIMHLGLERRGSSGDWRYLNRIPFWKTGK